MKYTNYIILVLLLFLGFALKDSMHVSTNLLSLFASKELIQKLEIADNLGYSKEMYVAVKGFDENAKLKINQIATELKSVSKIKLVQSSVLPSDEIINYYKTFYPILALFQENNQTKESIKEQLEYLYNKQNSSAFYTPIDKNDPLKLFHMPSNESVNVAHKSGYIMLENYGYLIRVRTDVSASEMNDAKTLYKDVHEILSKYPETLVFAPFFYTVENSQKIESEVQFIVILSTLILFFIYFVLLRNIHLLLHSFIALLSSVLFATLISTIFFDNFHIISLAFGTSLTGVSIDYLFHYYFHNFYQTKKRVDKNVLYGFLTTLCAFAVFSFIEVPFIAQISIFAVLSLSFAYILFTFLFPMLEIKEYAQKASPKAQNSSKKLSSTVIFLFSIALLTYSFANLQFDNNIRNLDYQNEKLMKIEAIFKSMNQNKMFPVLVEASSKEELLKNLHTLHENTDGTFSLASFVPDTQKCEQRKKELAQYDFERIKAIVNEEASKIGFRENYFKDAYSFTKNLPSCTSIDLEIFKTYNLSFYEHNARIYTLALIKESSKMQTFPFVSSIDVKQMFEKATNAMYESMVLFSFLVLFIILGMLLLSVKKQFLFALNYMLFPSSFVLSLLVTFSSVNIMHIFSLVILIAVGIDYGIYMSNSTKKSNTILAMRYSLLSTFAAFGVLVFSSITALNSIGVVISLGLFAIFMLMRGMK